MGKETKKEVKPKGNKKEKNIKKDVKEIKKVNKVNEEKVEKTEKVKENKKVDDVIPHSLGINLIIVIAFLLIITFVITFLYKVEKDYYSYKNGETCGTCIDLKKAIKNEENEFQTYKVNY